MVNLSEEQIRHFSQIATVIVFLICSTPAVLGQVHLSQLDGSVSQDEITDMKSIGHTGSADFFIGNDGEILRLSITSEPIHVASICIAQNETVTVYHASAALGKIVYQRLESNWVTEDNFNWEMRDVDMNPEAIRQRQQYFEKNSWVATTTGMGNAGETEFHFSISEFESDPIYLAAGLMLASNPDSIASFPEQNAGACADHSLVAGSPDSQYPFDYSNWAEISQ